MHLASIPPLPGATRAQANGHPGTGTRKAFHRRLATNRWFTAYSSSALPLLPAIDWLHQDFGADWHGASSPWIEISTDIFQFSTNTTPMTKCTANAPNKYHFSSNEFPFPPTSTHGCRTPQAHHKHLRAPTTSTTRGRIDTRRPVSPSILLGN